MLPTKNRVKKEFFSEIMKKGSFLSGDNFYIRFLDKKVSEPSLFSFIVPTKVVKTSSGRHLMKRKMSAAVEDSLKSFKPGFSFLVYASKNVSTLPFSKIKEEILNLFLKAKTLN